MSADFDLLVDLVIEQIKRGDPVPADIQARLVDRGVDVEALIQKHS